MPESAFVDIDEFVALNSSVPEIEQLRAMLSNLTRIHLLTASQFDSFDALIQEYIRSGIEVFGLETGIVSHINEHGLYTVCDVISPIDILEKGMEFQLQDTYCAEVFKSMSVVGFPHIGEMESMRCHPVYENLKLEAYLSAPIFVDRKLYGTFNFTSTKPRANGFSKTEHDLIQLMANSIGAYILLRQKEDSLLKLNEKMRRFVGYVAHDLRNPLGSIISILRLAKRKTDSVERALYFFDLMEPPAAQALEFASTILDSSAISTGKLSLNLQASESEEIIQQALDSVESLRQEKGIRITRNIQTLKLNCDQKRIVQALINLLINALKYSPRDSEVEISLREFEGAVNIQIINTVDTTNQQQLEQENKESIYQSVGFGLNIIQEILSGHGSKLTIEQEAGRYRAQFKLDCID